MCLQMIYSGWQDELGSKKDGLENIVLLTFIVGFPDSIGAYMQ